MENKLRELTEKIYSEGIEKAKSDAVVIINDAQKEADIIINKARQEAAEILSKAQDNAKEIKRNTEAEIKMASKQSLSKLKQQISELVATRVIDNPVKETLKDKEFIGTLIMKIAGGFNNNLELFLPEVEKNNLEKYFNHRTREELMKGIDIRFDPNIKSGFRISPKDDAFVISFTEEDFANYFKAFMRPKTIQLLFGEA
ncbi:MAG TPA: hypothetical protein VK212_10050 [Lentimicrobium sp.]|nr:hypothetical protein [Lentimicrobium sp.]